MSLRHARKMIWLLLPLFALRGLVPAGFMLDASRGGLTMVVCSGGVYKTIVVDERSGYADHVQDSGREQHEQRGDSICPFAIAASAATMPSLPSLPTGIEPVRNLDRIDVVSFYGPSGPSRAQQSRAPPYLS